MKILIIIPAFNESGSIQRLVDNLVTNYKQYDYIIINDGSSDNTIDICKNNNYNYVDLPINCGVSTALQTGLKYAYQHGYDYAVQIDGDGQHRPEYIKELLDCIISENLDIAVGSRFVTKKKPNTLRMLGSKILTGTIKLVTGKTLTDPTSGMRMFTRKAMQIYVENINFDPEPDTMAYLLKCGYKIKEIQVEMNDRLDGESQFINLSSVSWFMLRMFISILFILWFRRKTE